MNGGQHVPTELQDGVDLLARATARGLSTISLPGHVTVVDHPDPAVQRVAFVHSVGQSTKISTVTFLLQKRFRRALLESAGIPLPPAATFSFFAKSDPIRYAERVGFPVMVKEVFGENPAVNVRDIADPDELLAAAQEVRRHLPSRSERLPSSYAATINLSSAQMVDGELMKASSARFIVEKQISGELHRVFVVAGRTVMQVTRHLGGYAPNAPTAAVAELAEKAVAAVSGVDNAFVDVVVHPAGQRFVVELGERLIVPPTTTDRDGVAAAVSDALLAAELGTSLAGPGSPVQRRLRLVTVPGRPLPASTVVDGLQVAEAAATDGTVALEVNGTPERIAELTTRLLLNGLVTSVASEVEVSPS